MIRRLSISIALCIATLASAPALAQDDDDDDDDDDIADDDEDEDNSESKGETKPGAKTPSSELKARSKSAAPESLGTDVGSNDDDREADPSASEPLTSSEATVGDIAYRVIGFVRLEAAFVQSDPNLDFVGRSDGFRLQNARVGIEGRWRDRVSIRFSADGAIDERDNPNETEGTLRFELIDAYADIHVSSALNLRLARFQPIFDIERITSPSRRTFARRALSSRGVAAAEGIETDGLAVKRNLGLALRSDRIAGSDAAHVGYELAIQNGNGQSDAANDNDALAYSASMFATVADTIWVVAAGRYNRRNAGELPIRLTEDDFEVALGLRLDRAPFRAGAQLLARRTRFKTTAGPDRNAYGAHAEALLTVPGVSWLEAGYRYSLLEPSDLFPADRVQEHTVGANIALPAVRAAIQINATHAIEQSGAALENSRIEAVVQVSL